MKGKIIVITGIDGTGKETQTKMLLSHLKEKGINAKMQSFPNYLSESSAPLREYLHGKLPKSASKILPMQVASFFLVDFVQTMMGYEEFLNNGGVLLLDRYTESNLIHQAGRLPTEVEQIRFANTLKNFQYNSLKLPKPDLVICLSMPLEKSLELMHARNIQKNGGERDVHEEDTTHLENAHKMCELFAKEENWTVINCIDEVGRLREPHRIHNHIKNVVNNFLDFGIEKDV